MPIRCHRLLPLLVLGLCPGGKEQMMRRKQPRQKKFAWETHVVWNRLPEHRRQECQQLVAQLLREVAVAEAKQERSPHEQ